MSSVRQVAPEESKCHACGMPTKSPREYHPHAACLMFQACRDSRVVYANLRAVVEYGVIAGSLGLNDLAVCDDLALIRRVSEQRLRTGESGHE